jgi:histidinol phosphatase-like PHP family hydrolase
MIDLHMHSTLSDGELIPSEVVSRALFAGYTHLAITDHVDPSNVENVVERMVHVCSQLRGKVRAKVYPGVEITHVPPRLIAPLAAIARKRGAKVILMHGETIVEPVPKGTNLAAIRAKVNILAHPGLLSEEEATLQIIRGSGLTEKDAARMQANARELVER